MLQGQIGRAESGAESRGRIPGQNPRAALRGRIKGPIVIIPILIIICIGGKAYNLTWQNNLIRILN